MLHSVRVSSVFRVSTSCTLVLLGGRKTGQKEEKKTGELEVLNFFFWASLPWWGFKGSIHFFPLKTLSNMTYFSPYTPSPPFIVSLILVNPEVSLSPSIHKSGPNQEVSHLAAVWCLCTLHNPHRYLGHSLPTDYGKRLPLFSFFVKVSLLSTS